MALLGIKISSFPCFIWHKKKESWEIARGIIFFCGQPKFTPFHLQHDFVHVLFLRNREKKSFQGNTNTQVMQFFAMSTCNSSNCSWSTRATRPYQRNEAHKTTKIPTQNQLDYESWLFLSIIQKKNGLLLNKTVERNSCPYQNEKEIEQQWRNEHQDSEDLLLNAPISVNWKSWLLLAWVAAPFSCSAANHFHVNPDIWICRRQVQFRAILLMQ